MKGLRFNGTGGLFECLDFKIRDYTVMNTSDNIHNLPFGPVDTFLGMHPVISSCRGIVRRARDYANMRRKQIPEQMQASSHVIRSGHQKNPMYII